MKIKASGRSALILAAGLFVCFAGPSQAAAASDTTSADSKTEKAAGPPVALSKYVKHASRHGKKSANRKSGNATVKSASDSKNAAETDNTASKDVENSTTIPPSVANANAQLASAENPVDNAKAMTARANTVLQTAADSPPGAQAAADAQVVAADQLNDLDRAPAAPPARPMVMASADAAAAPAPAMASSSDSSTWDQTSLIGKIFIAFGGLLTLASAARMFMA